MLAGDLNLPDICLEDLEVLDCIKTSPAYGYENNSLFLDILNDFAFEHPVMIMYLIIVHLSIQ